MRYLLHGSVRYLVVVGAGGGILEGAYSKAARKIFLGEITTAKEFASELQKIIPNDAAFRTSFENARLSKAFIARYFLGALERAARGDEDWKKEILSASEFVLTRAIAKHDVWGPDQGWSGRTQLVALKVAEREGFEPS